MCHRPCKPATAFPFLFAFARADHNLYLRPTSLLSFEFEWGGGAAAGGGGGY
jgi:hypothetical protein